jgi:nucleoside-diphosphate-sugar epimerase
MRAERDGGHVPNASRGDGTDGGARRTIRRQRSRVGCVAVTGAARPLGDRLVRALLPSGSVRKTIAIDTIRGESEATWRLADPRDPALADRLRGVDTLVHLAIDSGIGADRAWQESLNVHGTAAALTAAAASGVRHVVIVTSAQVYGASPANPVPLDEDAEVRALPESGLLRDLLEMERLAAQAPRTHPGLSVSVVRPAAVVGPGVDTVITRHFEGPRLLGVKGTATCWQFCHVDDLISALVRIALRDLDAGGEERYAVFAVGAKGFLTRAEVERLSGKRHVDLPASVAFGTAERLHRIGVTPATAGDLQYLVYPWVVEPRRIFTLGWQPSYDNEAALRLLLTETAGRLTIGGHRLGRRDAAAGAAVGATVALVGTAALVRRARRRRRA